MTLITLDLILKEFPHLSIAKECESDEILEFYHHTEMNSRTGSITYKRNPNFFTFLKERSSLFYVILLRDDFKKIQGIGVLSFRKGFINQQEQTIGYLGDLRINFHKSLIREWREFYAKFIEHSPQLSETHFCKYFQTVIIDENKKATNNLITSPVKGLIYKKQMPYQMINIYGYFKLLPALTLFEISSMNDSNMQEVINFMNLNDLKRNFGREWNTELHHRLMNWHGFSQENFLIVKSSQGKLLAVTSYWNPIHSKQVSTNLIPNYLKTFAALAKFVPFLELKPIPENNKSMNILYLNQIHFDHTVTFELKCQILNSLIKHLFSKDFNLLAFCEFENEKILSSQKSFLTHNTKMALYSVHKVDSYQNIRDDLIQDDHLLAPGFDMVLV